MLAGWLTLILALGSIAAMLYLTGVSIATVGLVLAGVYVGIIYIYLLESYHNRE